MKRIINPLLSLFLMSVIAFTSCTNEIESNKNFDELDNTSKQTYITVGSTVITDKINKSSRTIVQKNTEDLTDFVLKGTPSGGSETQLATAENITKLSAAKIPVSEGDWDFILSAKIGEINFSGTTSATILASNTTNTPKTINFVLSSDVEYGGLNITMTFTGSADKVTVTLLDESKTIQKHTQDFTTFTAGANNTHTFTYTRDVSNTSERLENGTYFLNFDFYKIKDTEVLKLNTSRNLIRIANGINTSASLSVSLNDAYEITYKFYLDDTELTDTTGISPVEGILTSLFSKKTPTFTLPEMSKEGCTFIGWHNDYPFTDDNLITEITQGTTGPITLYALFEEQSSGGGSSTGTPAGLVYVDLGLPSGTLWANMNVGSTSETDPGTDYYWSVDNSREAILANYSTLGETLSATDDHATVEWGADWCTPTTTQIQELYDNCYFEPVTSYKGVTINGYVVYLAKDSSHTKLVQYANAFNNISNYTKTGYSDSDPHFFLPARNSGTEVWMWSSTFKGSTPIGGENEPFADLFGLADQWGDIIETALASEDQHYEYPVRPVSVRKSDFAYVEGAMINQNVGNGLFQSAATYPVTIRNLYVCKHEVTQAEYEKYCIYGTEKDDDGNLSATQYAPTDSHGKGNNYPAYFVSWLDAIVYCNLRSKAEHLTPVYSVRTSKTNDTLYSTEPSQWVDIVSSGGKYCGPNLNYYYDIYTNNWSYWEWISDSPGYESVRINEDADGYRLPTIEEWEYFARGGQGLNSGEQEYEHSGAIDDDAIPNVAHASQCQYGYIDEDSPVFEVQKMSPNCLGIYDLCGNVKEWCFDIVDDDGDRRIFDGLEYSRSGKHSCERDKVVGFRVVRNAQ